MACKWSCGVPEPHECILTPSCKLKFIGFLVDGKIVKPLPDPVKVKNIDSEENNYE